MGRNKLVQCPGSSCSAINHQYLSKHAKHRTIPHVFIEREASNSAKRILVVGPCISVIKDVNWCIFDLFGLDDLNIYQPRWVVSLFNGVEQILHVVVRLTTSQSHGSLGVHRLDTALRLEMPLDINVTSVCLVQRISVYAKSINVAQRLGDATGAEEMHQGMDSLWVVDVEIPKHAVVGHIGLGMALMAPVHRWELDGVTNEEDWQIIEDEILNTLLGVDFGSPTTDIANGITGTFFPTYSRHPRQKFRLLPLLQELGVCQVSNIVEGLKFAKGAGCLCMDAPTYPGQ